MWHFGQPCTLPADCGVVVSPTGYVEIIWAVTAVGSLLARKIWFLKILNVQWLRTNHFLPPDSHRCDWPSGLHDQLISFLHSYFSSHVYQFNLSDCGGSTVFQSTRTFIPYILHKIKTRTQFCQKLQCKPRNMYLNLSEKLVAFYVHVTCS